VARRSKSGAGGWLLQATIAAVVVGGLGMVAWYERPLWDADHFKWKASQADRGGPPRLELSIKPVDSSLGNEDGRLEPSLIVSCHDGHPNVTLSPLRVCHGGCTSDLEVSFSERFVTDAKATAAQAVEGTWRIPPYSEGGERFNYWASDPQARAAVDAQARAFIRKLAASKSFVASQGGDAHFDTSDLAPKLPQLWAVCPEPKG
jgi:hypothetical protein